MLLLMNRTTDGVWQGGCVDIPGWQFESGVKTGKFHPRDGSLYVVGLSGWQTSAKKDGCLHRIRYVGGQLSIPTKLSVHTIEVRMTFAQPLNRESVKNLSNYRIEQWNYIWAASYGSADWSVANPRRQGRDRMTVDSAELLADGRTVSLKIQNLKPVMQMETSYRLLSADGKPMSGIVYHTIHGFEPVSTLGN
jgi:hypothetical protein